MGRMKKNMADYRKEMVMLEARSNRPLAAAPSSVQTKLPEKRETPPDLDLKKNLPLWLQKILPTIVTILMTLIMLILYFFSMMKRQ